MKNATKGIPVAVIGVGKMGRNHARVLSMLKGVDPLYVYDEDPQKVEAACRDFGAIPLKTSEEAANIAKAVIIATPSKSHARTASFFLEKGIHCLVEKPLAEAREDCLMIMESSRRGGAVLAVGHIERFNPAVRELARLIRSDEHIFEIESKRLSFVDDRVMDVDVILDLMIHDLDVICSIVPGQIDVIAALSPQTNTMDRDGHACVLMNGNNKVAIKATASRVTQNKVRQLNVTGSFGYLKLDYSAQSLELTRKSKSHTLARDDTFVENASLDLSVEKFLIQNREPLMIELTQFIQFVTGDKNSIIVTGDQALRVMDLAWTIQKSLKDTTCHKSAANAA